MVRTVPAVLLGAGGATAAFEYGGDISDYFRDTMRSIMHYQTRPREGGGRWGGRDGDNSSSLAGEIEGLKRMMRENSRGNVVVVSKGSGAGWGLLTYGGLLAGLGYLYLRFVKGWKISDLMYVSQATLKASTGALKQGIEGLQDATAKTKEYLQGRLDTLEDNQDEHMQRTERIDENLTEVGSNVRQVQDTLGEIQEAQLYNNEGIFLLLRVVGELVCHNDFKIRSKSELEQFSRKSPPLKSGHPAPGLESLLEFNSASDPNAAESMGQGRSSGATSHVRQPPALLEDVTNESPTTSSATAQPASFPRVLTRSGSSKQSSSTTGGGVFGFGSLRR